ncbi:hypothetical protein TMM008_61200 [Pseudomonas sp. 008]|nr:hypothetical protein TMM008_61200 [Pseudomonas sp. 008]
MTTDTGMTAVGTIVEMIGAETNGVENSGAESKPVEKLNAIVIGSATMIGPCGTATRTITATIVASLGIEVDDALGMAEQTEV